jgi:Flp pilus assembly protein TadG
MPPIRRSSLQAVLRDQGGNAAVLLALFFPVILGVGALAVDAAHLYAMKTRLQGAADAAALAAAGVLPDERTARDVAADYAGRNLPAGRHGRTLAADDIAFGRWDEAAKVVRVGASPADAVAVTLRRAEANGNPVATFFAAALGVDSVDVAAGAVARAKGDPICILALEPDASDAIRLEGPSRIEARGCAVRVNSAAGAALKVGPVARVAAASVCVRGGVSGAGRVLPAPETGCPPVEDPLAALAPPPHAGCDFTGVRHGGGPSTRVTLSAGVYCGGLHLSGQVAAKLEPGVYVMKGGPLSVSGGATLTGLGVAFYLTGPGAVVDVSGTGAVDLAAPAAGDLAGILFFHDRDAPAGMEHGFRGGADKRYEGTIYVPNARVAYRGNGSGLSDANYGIYIARSFLLVGNASLELRSDYGLSEVPVPDGLKARGNRLVR